MEAIVTLKDRTGSSLSAIMKYLEAKYKEVSRSHVKRAIKSGIESELFAVHHKHKNSYKVGEKAKKAPKKKVSTPRILGLAVNKQHSLSRFDSNLEVGQRTFNN